MLFSVSAGVASVPVVCQGHGNCAPHASTRDFPYCPAALLFRHSLFCFARGQQHAVLTTAAFRQPITLVLLTFQCRVL